MTFENNNNKINDNAVPFETAINRAGFGLYSYLLTTLTGLSIISYACIIYSSTLVVPISECELSTTSAQKGLLVAMPLVGTIIGAIVWGYLADTRGRRSMLLVSFLGGALLNAVASISVNWIMLMIFQFFAALLASGQFSLAMTLLSECVPLAKRNLVVLVVASIFLLSQGIMSLIAMPIVSLDFSHPLPALGIIWNPWRTIILIYCAPSLICFAWIYYMQESPKFVLAKGDEDRSLEILSIIHRMNNRKSKEELQVKGLLSETEKTEGAEDKSRKPIMELFRPPLLKYFIIMSVLSIILKVSPFMVWLPTIANQFIALVGTEQSNDLTLCKVLDLQRQNIQLQETPVLPTCRLDQTALFIVFGVGVLQSVFNILLSVIVDRAGRRNTLIAVAAVCGASGILVNLVPNAVGSAVLFVVFLMAMVLTGINTAISVALFPTHLRALAVSLTMTGGRIALIADSQILNYLINNYCNVGFFLYTSIFALSAIVASFLPDDRRQRTPVEDDVIETETTQTPQEPKTDTQTPELNSRISS